MSSRFRSLVALAVTTLAVPFAVLSQASPAAAAVTIRDGFTDTLVTGTLGAAVDVTELPDGRMLVAAQSGQVWVVTATGTKVATPAVTVTDLCAGGEQGLLGIEADAGFATNGYIYVYYTLSTGGGCVNRVSRFTMTGNSAASETVLIDNIVSAATNHEGGDIQLGKDGYLYISSGDDGSGANAQNLSNLMGKILRIRPDGTIPTGNPFTGSDSASCAGGAQAGKKCQEIYAYGFRNPFRIAADPNASDTRIFVNDVGQGTAEEIDVLVAGGNYGWPTREGLCLTGGRSDCHPPQTGTPSTSAPIDPIFDYTHTGTGGCAAITGAAFVPNGVWPARYSGAYVYGDETCGKVWILIPDGAGGWTNEDFASGVGPFTSMRTVGQGASASLVYTTFANGGELHRITSNSAPGATGPSSFHPLTPTRVLDTRNGTGYTGRKPAAGDTISVQISGAASGVPSDAVAVALNVTGTESTSDGFVTVWPAGESRPLASTINFSSANDTVANGVIVRLGVGGKINLYTQKGASLVADVTGYWTETVTAQAGRYTPVPNPARLLDTRVGTGVATAGIVPNLGTVDLQVTGRGTVPSTGVSAVALVVTVTDTAASGYVTVWPTGLTMPLASSVNPVGAKDIRSNLVFVPVSATGKVSLFTLQATHLVVDVAGWFTDGTASSGTEGLLVATSPKRVLDTRNNVAPFVRLNAGDTALPDYSSEVPSDAIAVVTNLTIDKPAGGGYVTAWPYATGATLPLASNLNWSAANQTRAALAVSKLTANTEVGYYTFVATDLVIDLSGYFVGASNT